MNAGNYDIYYSCGCQLGMIIDIEEDDKLFLQVLYRRITRFSDGILKLLIWESVWVTTDLG
jgi:hypothetical protein